MRLAIIFLLVTNACCFENHSTADEKKIPVSLASSDFSDTEWWGRQQSTATTIDFDTILQTQSYIFLSNGPNPLVSEIALQCEAAHQLVLDFVHPYPTPHLQVISYFLYSSFEEKGMARHNTARAEIDFEKQEVHVIANESLHGEEMQAENALLIRQLLNKPVFTILEEGLQVYFAPHWQGKGFRYWAGRLYQSGNFPTLADLCDAERMQNESPLIRTCGAAVLVDFLLSTWGKEHFLHNYHLWAPTGEEISNWQQSWNEFLEKSLTNQGKGLIITSSPPAYMKGFNFAHEGYRVYNGYGGNKANASLTTMKDLGANATAIIPYTFMRNPQEPAAFPIPKNAGSENDECVIQALAYAHNLGMYTLLKPQIWVRRGWTGDIHMNTEADWNLFFDEYYRWIRHYALLGEMYHVNGLCIGVELTQTTLGHEKQWRSIIQKIRGLYNGQLTYAANWGEEFENIGFWDQLDFIGLNCYYPLSQNDHPTDLELKAGIDQVLSRAKKVQERFNKPLVFTEIGFRSVTAPWKNPHEEVQGRAASEEDQMRCYETVFEALSQWKAQKGIFWWKWPSDLDYLEGKSTEYAPYHKLAEHSVKEWFGKQ